MSDDPYPNYPTLEEYEAGVEEALRDALDQAINGNPGPLNAMLAALRAQGIGPEPLAPTVFTGYYPINDSPFRGAKPDDCRALAQTFGLFTWDSSEKMCYPVFGKTIPIWPSIASIMEGFMLVNFNFRTNGSQPPIPTPGGLPGPVKGFSEPTVNTQTV